MLYYCLDINEKGAAVATTVMNKWGNSKGIVVPKSICDAIGADVGDSYEIEAIPHGGFRAMPAKRFHRSRKLTAAEVFEGWDGEYELPDELKGPNSVGNEADWGEPRGNELW